MKAKQGIVRSGTKSLMPIRIVDKATGEIVSYEEAFIQIDSLITFVQSLAQKVFDENYDQLMIDLENAHGSATSYGRQLGYDAHFPNLPKHILIKSRIKELYLHKLINEGLSHAKLKATNPINQGKHKMGYSINLGAVNSSMATREIVGDRIILGFKCWEREFIFEFAIPPFIASRNIAKLSLPTIGRKGFDFTVEEIVPQTQNKNIAGVDLGKINPFTMAVLNEDHTSPKKKINSGRLSQMMQKSARLLNEKQELSNKVRAYQSLGLDSSALEHHRDLVRAKNTRLNKEIAHKIGREIVDTAIRHEVGMIHLEDLRWATGKKYGGRWNHGAQNDSITHKAHRAGLRVKRVNPRNTSQQCHNCGTKITHQGRKVRCSPCQTILDRDYNAALNIAKDVNKKKRFPLVNGTKGVTCSSTAVLSKQSNETMSQSINGLDQCQAVAPIDTVCREPQLANSE